MKENHEKYRLVIACGLHHRGERNYIYVLQTVDGRWRKCSVSTTRLGLFGRMANPLCLFGHILVPWRFRYIARNLVGYALFVDAGVPMQRKENMRIAGPPRLRTR